MLRVLLVDDHAVVRNGMRQILQNNLESVETGEASDANATIIKIRNSHWDLVLLDIRLPGRSGVDVLKQIKTEKPQLPVLILSTYPESQYAVRLIHAGAAGYLNKDAEEEEILKAIRLAISGHKYISEIVGELLANHVNRNISDQEGSLHDALSNREYQIFLELASGIGPKEIANKLQLSAKTVTTYRARILQKMGFTNNAELILYANHKRLIL